MEIYTSDNEKVKILTQDSGMLYIYSTKPGDLLGEGERLDSLTLTPDEMISLGRTLTTRGEAFKHAQHLGHGWAREMVETAKGRKKQ
mgnify:CR=1 FL=1|tara:strand:- start:282 stop:542 length:261 start_codon:yes stop_codon:yes gene_type:complete